MITKLTAFRLGRPLNVKQEKALKNKKKQSLDIVRKKVDKQLKTGDTKLDAIVNTTKNTLMEGKLPGKKFERVAQPGQCCFYEMKKLYSPKAPFKRTLKLKVLGEELTQSKEPQNRIYTRFRSNPHPETGVRRVIRLINAQTVNTIPRAVFRETILELQYEAELTKINNEHSKKNKVTRNVEPLFTQTVVDVKTSKPGAPFGS